MFQAQNRETINSAWKVAVSFEITMTTSVTRLSHHNTRPARPRPRPRPSFFVWNRSCPKTYGLRPHHCGSPVSYASFLPIFILLCPSILDLGSGTGQTDRRGDDGHQRFMPSPYGGRGIIIASCNDVLFLLSPYERLWPRFAACSGNALVSIHWARLVLGWVTAFGHENCLTT